MLHIQASLWEWGYRNDDAYQMRGDNIARCMTCNDTQVTISRISQENITHISSFRSF
jgi:hypothetical protein